VLLACSLTGLPRITARLYPETPRSLSAVPLRELTRPATGTRIDSSENAFELDENTMATDDLEKRVAALEVEVAKLKATSDSTAERPHQWWNEIAGSFA